MAHGDKITRKKIWASHLHAARHCAKGELYLEAGEHLLDAMQLASEQRERHEGSDIARAAEWFRRYLFAADCFAGLGEMERAAFSGSEHVA